jgi:DNA gyrase subunit A
MHCGRLSEAQAGAILDLRLHRLTGLEQDKIVDEYKKLLDLIDGYLEILGSATINLSTKSSSLVAVADFPRPPRRCA